MIRVYRPKKEPAALATQRRSGLARAFAALNQHGAGSRQLKSALTDYDGGKELLFKRQHRKCAWCERMPGFEGNPVEHFRPKSAAKWHLPGHSPNVAPSGYWWLTWTWENQLFSCTHCNSGFKGTWFPLASGSGTLVGPAPPYGQRRLASQHLNTAAEKALLIDPACVDPLDHIEWRLTNRSSPRRLWKWTPIGLTAEGSATIDVLGVTALADDLRTHLKKNVYARTDAVRAAIAAKNYGVAAQEWARLGRELASADSVLAGPTWNALHVLVDSGQRKKASLPVLPRP